MEMEKVKPIIKDKEGNKAGQGKEFIK